MSTVALDDGHYVIDNRADLSGIGALDFTFVLLMF
jgi:hypothetical protein